MEKKELARLGKSSWEQLKDAVLLNDKEKSLQLIDSLSRNTEAIYGFISDTVDLLLTRIADKEGEEVIYEMQKSNYHRVIGPSPFMAGFAALDSDEKLRQRVGHWTRLHSVTVEIEEDEEKFTIRVPCNTGGHLVDKGSYGGTKQGYVWSAGMKDVAYYCIHCLVGFELEWSKQYGQPVWITIPPREAGEKCTQFIYKKSENIPAEYFERLGLAQPE